MFDMTKIGLNIARLRKESGMTQMELADRLGISYQAVSSWERGSTMPDISKLPLLADSFGVSIDDILNGGRGADLVRKIVSGPVEETLQPGEVSAEEFRELAPLLPSKQADAVFGRTEQPSGLSELIAVAPFISEDVLGECALRAFDTVALSELVALAPFLDEKAVDELALRAYGTSGISGMVALAPFMSQAGLGNVVKQSGAQASSVGERVALAPFLASDVVSELVDGAIRASDFKGLAALAPFMDRDRLDALARGMVADNGRESEAAASPSAASEQQETHAEPTSADSTTHDRNMAAPADASAPSDPGTAVPRSEGIAAPRHPAAPSAPVEARAPRPEDQGGTDGPKFGSYSSSFADHSR